MYHCCKVKPDDMYYLSETNFYTSRVLYIGFCPICNKPVAELVEWRFDGIIHKTPASGVDANELLIKHKDEILYSMKECNYRKTKSKPYGWKYGINRQGKSNGKTVNRQYACDFYGNKELVKISSSS